MLYTKLSDNKKRPQTVITTFGGLQVRPDVPDGCWRDECNLSSGEYPRASVRRRRTICEELDGNVFASELVGTQTVRGVVAASGGEELVLLDEEGYLWCGGKYVRLTQANLAWHVDAVDGGVTIYDESKALTAFGQTEGIVYFKAVDEHPIVWYWKRDGGSWAAISSPGTYGVMFKTNPQDGDTAQARVVKRFDKPRDIVRIGAYAVILPDKLWVNVVQLKTKAQGAMVSGTDYGSWDNEVKISNPSSESSTHAVVLTMCDRNGVAYSNMTVDGSAPVSPDNGDKWLDTANMAVNEWSDATSQWVNIPTTYVKVASTGIGAGFAQYDGVEIDSYVVTSPINSGTVEDMTHQASIVKLLHGYNILEQVSPDAVVITGIMDCASATVHLLSPAGTGDVAFVSFTRSSPELDYVVETGNRLWGCHYGKDASGQILNEIYACKLGDFKNWNCYEGISTDSYTASRGSDGPYTGAAVLDGHPLFFKESCVEKVFPSTTGAHQISTITLDGVEQGGDRSLVVIDNVLYYKSRDAVVRYTGTLPQTISGALGHDGYTDASAGRHGKQYRVMMRNRTTGDYAMYVYDTERGFWHREDAEDAGDEQVTVTWRDRLYITDPAGRLWAIDGAADSRLVKWYAESGEIGLSMPGRKYITRLDLRFKLELGAVARVYVSYDGGPWHRKSELRGNRLAPSLAMIFPRRCDHLRIRLEGIGGCELQSMAYRVREGSEACV